MTEALAPGAEGAHLLSRAAVIATAAVFGLTYSLTAPLIALDLAERGFTEAMIGANAAMHAVGVLLTAMLLPRLVGRWRPRALVVGALLLAAVTLALFPAMPLIWLWFPLRFLLGCASEVLFVLSETWINHLSEERSRARSMAAYTAALSLGFALGPLILSLLGTDGAVPYLAGAAIAALAIAFVLPRRVEAPEFGEPHPGGLWRSLRLAPIAIATTVLNAALETAGLSFLAIYAVSSGWPEGEATRLISAMMFGAILLQIPIGWLGDRLDRRRLTRMLGILSVAGALLWPVVIHNPWLAYPVVFVWGGVFVGIYTLMLTLVGSRFRGTELVGIYAVMAVTWGVGALLGPALAGLAMAAHPHGLAFFAAAACLAFVLFMGRVRSTT